METSRKAVHRPNDPDASDVVAGPIDRGPRSVRLPRRRCGRRLEERDADPATSDESAGYRA